MKELSIEEKAKAYDEAKLRMSAAYNSNRCTIGFMNEIFPELKESEGERIRKEILNYIINGSESLYDVQQYGKEKFEKWISWLKKQGEHANFCTKIQIGDKVTRNEDGVLVNLSQLKRVAKKDERQGEQRPAEWSGVDESLRLRTIGALETCKIGSPTKCVDEQIKWLKSIKDRVQPKQGWSEEDEKMIHHIENAIKYDKSRTYLNSKGIEIIDVCNWLKSLRPQNHWKPSEEQMDALHYVTNFDYGGHKATLVSLYEQLKKLRER